jgi:uncharacterized protein YneF (UPF0154 family)
MVGNILIGIAVLGLFVLMYLFVTKKLIWKDVKKDVKTKAEQIKEEMKKKGKL